MPKKGVDMVSPFLLDEHLNGMSDEFLDNVIKHIDFPLEDLEGNALTEDWDASFQLLELPSPDDLTGISANFKLCDDNSGSLRRSSKKEVKPKLKDSSLGNSETNVDRNVFHHGTFEGKDSSMFPSSSSVSVLESGSSWSADNSLHFGYRFFIPVKRARSKRLRPLTLNPRLPIPFVSCSDKRKGKKKNMSVLSVSGSSTGETDHPHLQLSGSSSGGTRKCTHCEVTKTPQWREGPMGPKTLCNACGVRYRSGRLFPEYRPAASPTFVASMHSNSHKKVVEMRKKSTREAPMAAIDSLRAPQFGNSNGCLSV